jgi:multidrug efflux pump subunit AcrA (membrane-fusion protein)
MTSVYLKQQGRWRCVASHAGLFAGVTHPTAGTPAQEQANPGSSQSMAAGSGRRLTTPAQPGDTQPAQSQGQGQMMMSMMSGGSARHAQRVTRIRPRFECLVEKRSVNPGEVVKKGDPLLGLFSTDLAAAKNDFLNKEMRWKRDQRLLQMRQKLYQQNSIAEQVLVDAQNDEEKSKLEFQVARDRLKVFMGLDDTAIQRIGEENGEQKARLTLRSPVDGTIVEVGADLGSLYDTKSVLIVIQSTLSEGPALPQGSLRR